MNVDIMDKSLNKPINSKDENKIMQKIRQDYLSGSTVTICLIGAVRAESLEWGDQKFIKKGLKASSYN